MKFTVVVTSTNDSHDLVMYDFICNDLPLILYVIICNDLFLLLSD